MITVGAPVPFAVTLVAAAVGEAVPFVLLLLRTCVHDSSSSCAMRSTGAGANCYTELRGRRPDLHNCCCPSTLQTAQQHVYISGM